MQSSARSSEASLIASGTPRRRVYACASAQAGTSIAESANGLDQTAQGFDAVTGTINDITTALGILTPTLNLETIAQQAAKTAATEHAESIVNVRAEVDAARAALDKLVTSGIPAIVSRR
jgi:hypothetical protein